MGSRSTTNPKSTAVARETDRSPTCAVNPAPVDYGLERQDFGLKMYVSLQLAGKETILDALGRKKLTQAPGNGLQMPGSTHLGSL